MSQNGAKRATISQDNPSSSDLVIGAGTWAPQIKTIPSQTPPTSGAGTQPERHIEPVAVRAPPDEPFSLVDSDARVVFEVRALPRLPDDNSEAVSEAAVDTLPLSGTTKVGASEPGWNDTMTKRNQ
ncbi:hypothetical protein E8E13_003109 [Curvularia kusanoi]|uniref:Uncharacterized protein n=1 Tax=Curvularia kusanoi TaxID=90978 RepID=A0A9P4TBY5_CURKU|nr:hypothetical protein E8E13_003109 [Curvularia kusanoi]